MPFKSWSTNQKPPQTPASSKAAADGKDAPAKPAPEKKG